MTTALTVTRDAQVTNLLVTDGPTLDDLRATTGRKFHVTSLEVNVQTGMSGMNGTPFRRVYVEASGPVLRKDGTPGKATATRTLAGLTIRDEFATIAAALTAAGFDLTETR